MYYEWREAMKTGNARIDEQHQALMTHLDHLLKKASYGDSRLDLETDLRFFENYVIEHFTDEELLHQTTLAPNLEAHIQAHRGLILLMEALVHDLKVNGVSFSLELRVYNGLVKALIEQVHRFDVPLASYLKGQV